MKGLHQFCTLHDVTVGVMSDLDVLFSVFLCSFYEAQHSNISNPEQNLYLSPKTFIRPTKRKCET